ncbi:MAG TPA: hypothetical protein PKH07_19090, partial [bacterium]|nr:hypothetical protein [bacterium]
MASKALDKFLRPSSKTGQYTFICSPLRPPEGYVQQFREKLLKECSRTPGLLSLYEDRRTFYSGIGVLRLIGIFDPKLVNPSRGSLSQALETADPEGHIGRQVLCVTPELFQSLRRIDCLLEPEKFWGQKYPIQALPDEQKRYQYVIRLMDLFVAGHLETMVRAAVERVVNTADFLARSSQMCLFLDLVKDILREPSIPEWDEFQRGFQDLATKWNSRHLKRYMDIMPWVPKALEIILDALERMDGYFVKSNIVNFKPGADAEAPQAAFVTENQAVAFLCPWSPSRGLEVMLRLMKEHETFVDVLPATFALQLYEYCKGSGGFHKYVKSCFKMEAMTGHMERPNL